MQYNKKKVYLAPEIKLIKLDNEISLALESAPPDGPGEFVNLNNSESDNPFKPLLT